MFKVYDLVGLHYYLGLHSCGLWVSPTCLRVSRKEHSAASTLVLAWWNHIAFLTSDCKVMLLLVKPPGAWSTVITAAMGTNTDTSATGGYMLFHLPSSTGAKRRCVSVAAKHAPWGAAQTESFLGAWLWGTETLGGDWSVSDWWQLETKAAQGTNVPHHQNGVHSKQHLVAL